FLVETKPLQVRLHPGKKSHDRSGVDHPFGRLSGVLTASGECFRLLRRPGDQWPTVLNSVGAPPLTRNTTGPCAAPERAAASRPAMAFAANTGSRNTPSVRATRSAAAADSFDGSPY